VIVTKHNLDVADLALQEIEVTKEDLDSLGSLVMTLKFFHTLTLVGSFAEGASWLSSDSFCDALKNKTSLERLVLDMDLFSHECSKRFSEILRSQNCSLVTLDIDSVDDDDCLATICDGLSFNKSLKMFCCWPILVCNSTHRFEKKVKACLETNQSLKFIDFAENIELLPDCSAVAARYKENKNAMWSPSQVCAFCTALKSNNVLVALDITGCYINKKASDAVCAMISINVSLQSLFLNPIHMEEPEAVNIVKTCNNQNNILELLSLYQCPAVCEDMWTEEVFEYANTFEMNRILYEMQESRQRKNIRALNIIWLVVYEIVHIVHL